MLSKWGSVIIAFRSNSHDFCEVVTRMLYGNVLQIDKHYYVIIASTGSSPVVLVSNKR